MSKCTDLEHAHWIEDKKYGTMECSHCGQSIDVYYHQIDIEDFEFCFGCGAKMGEVISDE